MFKLILFVYVCATGSCCCCCCCSPVCHPASAEVPALWGMRYEARPSSQNMQQPTQLCTACPVMHTNTHLDLSIRLLKLLGQLGRIITGRHQESCCVFLELEVQPALLDEGADPCKRDAGP